jgi:hypothetical protein
MSGDEVVVTCFALVLGPLAWGMWLFDLARVRRLSGARPHLGILSIVVATCAAVLTAVLVGWAAPDVRGAPDYLVMYLVLGLAWMRVGGSLFAYAGVSVRDDVVERHNPSALAAVSGAFAGVTFCYAGGNIGSGPGWYVVLFSAALATAGLGAIWLLLDQLAGASDGVTIERDAATGLRLGGLLAASGVVLGRAVSGDWHSAGETLQDFALVGWPVLPLATLALLMEWKVKPTVERPRPSPVLSGVLPAVLYLGLAVAYVIALGTPS